MLARRNILTRRRRELMTGPRKWFKVLYISPGPPQGLIRRLTDAYNLWSVWGIFCFSLERTFLALKRKLSNKLSSHSSFLSSMPKKCDILAQQAFKMNLPATDLWPAKAQQIWEERSNRYARKTSRKQNLLFHKFTKKSALGHFEPVHSDAFSQFSVYKTVRFPYLKTRPDLWFHPTVFEFSSAALKRSKTLWGNLTTAFMYARVCDIVDKRRQHSPTAYNEALDSVFKCLYAYSIGGRKRRKT